MEIKDIITLHQELYPEDQLMFIIVDKYNSYFFYSNPFDNGWRVQEFLRG